jgi:hypothetical protein
MQALRKDENMREPIAAGLFGEICARADASPAVPKPSTVTERRERQARNSAPVKPEPAGG